MDDCRPIGTTFQSNKVIKYFDELRFFTKVANAQHAFRDSTIKRVTIDSPNWYFPYMCASGTRARWDVIRMNATKAFAESNWGTRGMGNNGETTILIRQHEVVGLAATQQGKPKYYVPDDLVDAYKTATNWSSYASFIYPLSEYTGD